MQTLTAQYPIMYTRKFRVSYLDYISFINRGGDVTLFTLPRANQIISAAFHLETKFIGTGITDSFVMLFPNNNLPAIGTNTNHIGTYRTFNNPSDKNGTFVPTPQVSSNSAPVNNQNWCNFSTPTDIILRMQLPAGQLLSNLTQGSLLVWVTSMRLS